jgi:hypothetical protein
VLLSSGRSWGCCVQRPFLRPLDNNGHALTLLGTANEFAPYCFRGFGLIDSPCLAESLHESKAPARCCVVRQPSHRCVRKRPAISDGNSDVRIVVRNAHDERCSRVNYGVCRELADNLRHRPLVVRRATRLEHCARKASRLRNAARCAIELDVGFLHTPKTTRTCRGPMKCEPIAASRSFEGSGRRAGPAEVVWAVSLRCRVGKRCQTVNAVLAARHWRLLWVSAHRSF